MSDVPDDLAGMGELVALISQIATLRRQYPSNPMINQLYDASNQMKTAELFDALAMDHQRQASEINSQRQSPLAKMMK